MRLLIKNKLVSMGGSSKVTTEEGAPAYIVKGKVFSIRRKKKITDTSGNILYRVRNKFWNFIMHSAFVCDAKGNKLCKVKRKFSFKSNFVITGYGDEIRVDGDIIGRNFTVYRNEQPIGAIKQHFLTVTDTFMLESYNDADAPFLVALVIAIDNIFDKHNS